MTRKRLSFPTLDSTFIERVEHDQHGVLTVFTKSGGKYPYRAPLAVFRQFEQTRSAGKLYNFGVKNVFPRADKPDPQDELDELVGAVTYGGPVDLLPALTASVRAAKQR